MTSSAPHWQGQGDERPREPREVTDRTQELREAAGRPLPDRREAAGGRPVAREAASEPRPLRNPAAGRAGAGGRPALRVVPEAARHHPPPGPPPAAGDHPDDWGRLAGLREPSERDLAAARRRARPHLRSPMVMTRDVAMALLEVEAGCRSAVQIERICSPELWARLEHRIGRRGGPLPSGRSVVSVRCQEHRPGVADTVVVVRRGERMLPVAMRLDAAAGRWVVTELRWWCTEHDEGPPGCRGDRGKW
jgi:hypothetical protein